MYTRISRHIYKELLGATRVLLVPHRQPDGDALGSVTALADFLAELKIPHILFSSTEYPGSLGFLPYTENIKGNEALDTNNEIPFSHVIVVDSGDPVYAGIADFLANADPRPLLINIDHHPTNLRYGDINLVIEQASSTTEILYGFFRANRVPITRNMATGLLTGLITDTGNFTNMGTSRLALDMGADLIARGADLVAIRDHILKNKSVNALKLWGIVLSRLEIHPEHQIAYTYLTQKDLRAYTVSEDETEGIANLLNHLQDGRAALVLKEQKEGGVKASLRTTEHNVDVSVIARHFGGGGHKKAAGFSLPHSVEDALKHIFEHISRADIQFVSNE